MKQVLRFAYLGLLITGCMPTGPDSSQLDDLRRHRGQWEGRQPTHYEFIVQRSCECVPPWTNPLRVTVRGGQVLSVANAQTEESVPMDSDLAKSIEDLFGLLEQALEHGAYQVTAAYDPDFGYPTSIYIDSDEQMVDEEIGYSVRDLRAVD